MQENHPNSDVRTVTQPHIAHWTDDELALLERLARRKPRKAELLRIFPRRTYAAIKVKLSAERRRLGVTFPAPKFEARGNGTTMLHPNDPGIRDSWQRDWREKAVAANNAYLAVLQRAAA